MCLCAGWRRWSRCTSNMIEICALAWMSPPQFPAVYEEPVLRMVQHATQPVDELCTSLQKHLHSRLCPVRD